MKVTAVILNYRRADDTLACVASLVEDSPDVEVIVVDNASRDGGDVSRALPSGVRFIANDRNLGYAGGNNPGIRAALDGGAEAVLVLNNDLVVEPGCVEALRRALVAHEDWGVAGPLSLLGSDPNVVDFFSARVDLEHVSVVAEGRDGPMQAIAESERETDYVTGSAMLLRRAALERAGLFDERFFLVWEDVDLCLRIRRAGMRCGVTKEARVLHARSASFGGDTAPLHRYFFARNSFLMVRKHLRPPARWRAEAFAARRYRVWGSGDTDAHRAIRTGLRHGLAGRWGPPPRWLAG